MGNRGILLAPVDILSSIVPRCKAHISGLHGAGAALIVRHIESAIYLL